LFLISTRIHPYYVQRKECVVSQLNNLSCFQKGHQGDNLSNDEWPTKHWEGSDLKNRT
jgi:hypothetical protein